ncbi:hypothetical protein [Geoglobus ahangari]|uniref:hypothetical protein n=1 Tax=Geoglobus ahangari TaxID=113653 RepID=UPI0012EC67AA|nr:hypothetical protein [Geoglobus ahangari]
MTERDKKRLKFDPASTIDLEFEKIKKDMTPGSIRIVKGGSLIKRRILLVAYTTDERIIVIDLDSGAEIYRSDKNE